MPLQRVLLSGVLSISQRHELRAISKALDPLRLFQQVEQLQQATLRCAAGHSSASQPTPKPSTVQFELARCTAELVLQEAGETDALQQEQKVSEGVLNWRRTGNPFAGQWEQILVWVRADPTCSSGGVLRELQDLFPGRYEHSHLRTLQRGIRKIRAHLLRIYERAGSPEEPLAHLSLPAGLQQGRPSPESPTSSSFPGSVGAPSPGDMSAHLCDGHQAAEELSSRPGKGTRRSRPAALTPSKCESDQLARLPQAVSSPLVAHSFSPDKCHRLTIERAVQEYLHAHRAVGHRPKTLE